MWSLSYLLTSSVVASAKAALVNAKPMDVAVSQYNLRDKNGQLSTKLAGWIWTCVRSLPRVMWTLVAHGLHFVW